MIYAANSVNYHWLVDPIAQNLEVQMLKDGMWSTVATAEGDVEVRLPPFESSLISLKFACNNDLDL